MAAVLFSLLAAGAPPAVASGAGGQAPSLPPTLFATVSAPDAIAASASTLYVLSSNDCSTVWSVSSSGTVSAYAHLPAKASCTEQAIVISPGFGNFPAGAVYVTQGANIFAIPPNDPGVTVSVPFVSIPALASHPGLTFDYYGAFGYGLVATGGSTGAVFAVNATGAVFPIATIGAPVQNPAVAPLSYGSYGGDLFASSQSGPTVYAVTPSGSVGAFTTWKSAESVAFVPPRGCTFSSTGFSYFVAEESANALLAFPASDFATLSGYGLVAGESATAGIGLVTSDGSVSPFYSPGATLEGSSYVSCPMGVAKASGFSPSVDANLVGYDPANQQVIGADFNSTNLLGLNGANGGLLKRIGTGGVNPVDLAWNGETNVLYVANTGSNNVTELNASTDAVLGSFRTGPSPSGIAYDPSNQKLYVSISGSGIVSVYSEVNRHLRNIFVGGEPLAAAYDARGGSVLVADGTGHFDVLQGFRLVRVLNLPSGATDIAVDPVNGRAYVTLPGLDAVAVVAIFPSSCLDHVIALVPVGSDPTSVAFDSDHGLVFVANAGDGTLSVINGTTVVDTVLVGADPGPLVYDPSTDLVWVTADVSVAGIDPRIILGVSS